MIEIGDIFVKYFPQTFYDEIPNIMAPLELRLLLKGRKLSRGEIFTVDGRCSVSPHAMVGMVFSSSWMYSSVNKEYGGDRQFFVCYRSKNNDIMVAPIPSDLVDSVIKHIDVVMTQQIDIRSFYKVVGF
jgi:hypothetical protein